MIELIKRWIQFQIKNVEFRFRTWKNAYNITKAYSSLNGKKRKAFQYSKKLKVSILSVIAAVLITGIAVEFVRTSDFQLLKGPEAAIVNERKLVERADVNVEKDRSMILKEISRVGSILQGRSVMSTDTTVKDSIVRKAPQVDSLMYVYDSTSIPVSDSGNDFKVIVANKARHILYLLDKKQKDKWKVVRTFFIGYGAQPGRKLTAGDKRTPEGLYMIVERKERYQLASIYGPLAYVLDYPNPKDREEGRTGQGIWIHGTERDSFPGETKGCLELNNPDLVNLSLLLRSGKGTPVFIVNDSALTKPENYIDTAAISLRHHQLFDSAALALKRQQLLDSTVKVAGLQPRPDTVSTVVRNQTSTDSIPAVGANKQQVVDTQKVAQVVVKTKADTTLFSKFVSDWVNAWESQSIEEYSKFYYHSKFKSQGMNWVEWKDKKEKTFSLYDTINVTYGKVALSGVTDSTAVLMFPQVYKTEKTRFQNNKRLDLEKEQGSWKITREAAF